MKRQSRIRTLSKLNKIKTYRSVAIDEINPLWTATSPVYAPGSGNHFPFLSGVAFSDRTSLDRFLLRLLLSPATHPRLSLLTVSKTIIKKNTPIIIFDNAKCIGYQIHLGILLFVQNCFKHTIWAYIWRNRTLLDWGRGGMYYTSSWLWLMICLCFSNINSTFKVGANLESPLTKDTNTHLTSCHTRKIQFLRRS